MPSPPPPVDLQAIRAAYEVAIERQPTPFRLTDAFPLPSGLPGLWDQVARLKSYLDAFRPLNADQATKLHAVFDTEYTYHSNRIEGNTLTLRETDLVVNRGITIGGKTVREHLEAVNHAEAVATLRALVDHDADVDDRNVLALHAIVMRGIDQTGAGRYRDERVFISGSRHVPPNPAKVPSAMADFFAWYKTSKSVMHPVQLAAEIHLRLVTVHPFRDGNGRTSRLVMNLVLLRNGYPITVLSGDQPERLAYYEALEAANLTQPIDTIPFTRFVADNVRHWLLRYLDMVSVGGGEATRDKGGAFFAAIAPLLDLR